MLSRLAAAAAAAMAPARTHLAFHHDAKLLKLTTKVTAVHALAALDDATRQLYKPAPDAAAADDDPIHVVITESTIFHPQGGGQPSDVGSMTGRPDGRGALSSFDVRAARTDDLGQVLHFGHFSSSAAAAFAPGDAVEQAVDAARRLLYSRLHTAGHVLGAAVRHLLQDQIAGFDELKASHFPDAAACEFAGRIGAEWREPVQRKVDEYVAAAMPVEIEWWDEEDFRRNGLARLIPENGRGLLASPGDKFRVVRIVGAEVYPCGGTHVDSTDLCGETKVKKISRSKGTSRVSYTVA